MKLTLTHLEGKQRTRTNTMTGEGDWPVIGERFFIWNDEPLDPEKESRSISTSPVREIEKQEDGSVNIRTRSGTLYNVKENDCG